MSEENLDEQSRVELIATLANKLSDGSDSRLTEAVFRYAISAACLRRIKLNDGSPQFSSDGDISWPDKQPSEWWYNSDNIDDLIDEAVSEREGKIELAKLKSNEVSLANLLNDGFKYADPVFGNQEPFRSYIPADCIIGDLWRHPDHYIYEITNGQHGNLKFLRDSNNQFTLRYIYESIGEVDAPDVNGNVRKIDYSVLAVFVANEWHTVGVRIFDKWSFTLPVYHSEFDANQAEINGEEWLKSGMA